MRKEVLLLTAAAALFTSGCINPAIFRKGAFAVDDWETWMGWNDAYGSHEVKSDGLYYRLTALQDDSRDEASDGYFPGLLLSRDLPGERWQADVETDYKIPPGRIKRFSFGVWVGWDASRPSIGNAAATFKALVQRQNGPRPQDDSLTLFFLPSGRSFALPKTTRVLRFERDGNFFSVSYALDKKTFVPVLRLDAGEAAAVPVQKFFIGGFSGGDPQGAFAKFKSFKINGKETLR